tara:strand:- start:225 stop:620 length:396 start_codon:yes stop_codon:yes gene_type:complete
MKTKTKRKRSVKKLYKGGEERRVVIDLSETINLFVRKLTKLFEEKLNDGVNNQIHALKADFQQRAQQKVNDTIMQNVGHIMPPGQPLGPPPGQPLGPPPGVPPTLPPGPLAGGRFKKTRRLKKRHKSRKKK